ncbi:hypothetical protein FMJ16_23925 [Klebsiella michiganensis]|nr:hypothetical protein [Klebsiella michiganensis]MBZ6646073.1 hypothetical protein [Klebsiella michiganensis]MBZ7372954.1 hypothetical protein [Klebsiella michiganensis]
MLATMARQDYETRRARQKQGKQRYEVTESWLKTYKHWYSPSGKRYKATASAIAIYSFIAGLTEQKKVCYANQETLGDVGSVEPRQVRNIIKLLEDVGVIHVERRRGQTSICTALPFTNAHVIPPEALTAQSVIVSDEVPAPVPVKAAEENSVSDFDDLPFVRDVSEYLESPVPTPTIPTQQEKPEFPWGGVVVCKPNGDPTDAALKWAHTETMGDEEAAYQLISRVVSERTGRTEDFTPQTEEDFDSIPF